MLPGESPNQPGVNLKKVAAPVYPAGAVPLSHTAGRLLRVRAAEYLYSLPVWLLGLLSALGTGGMGCVT